jgi:hypothetical protein
VRLPERLPAVPPPGVFPIGVYYLFEDGNGAPGNRLNCGVLDLTVAEGYRSEVPLHDGRFVASVAWNTSGQDHSGFAVPTDGAATTRAFSGSSSPAIGR